MLACENAASGWQLWARNSRNISGCAKRRKSRNSYGLVPWRQTFIGQQVHCMELFKLDVQISLAWVSLQLGCPQRLLMGNEMPSQSQAEAVLGPFSLLLKPSDRALLLEQKHSFAKAPRSILMLWVPIKQLKGNADLRQRSSLAPKSPATVLLRPRNHLFPLWDKKTKARGLGTPSETNSQSTTCLTSCQYFFATTKLATTELKEKIKSLLKFILPILRKRN